MTPEPRATPGTRTLVTRAAGRPGLVVRDDGQTVNPQTLSQGFDRAVAKTGLPKLSLHGLRHTHATLLQTRRVAADASFDGCRDAVLALI
jgi:integrase